MNEAHSDHHDSTSLESIKSHRFFWMITFVIAISLFLVYVALSLYQSSGTLQLDLSRPGYDSARKEAIKDTEVFKGFAADGAISQPTLEEFNKLYSQKASEALINIDAFSGDALSDQTLGLN